MLRLLIDEHLSPRLARWAAERRGLYAVSVAHAGLGGRDDRVLWTYAYQNDLSVVTTNRRDFVSLLATELHPGLIVLRESGLSRDEQWARLDPVIGYVLAKADLNFMINKLIEVRGPVHFEIYEIPAL